MYFNYISCSMLVISTINIFLSSFKTSNHDVSLLIYFQHSFYLTIKKKKFICFTQPQYLNEEKRYCSELTHPVETFQVPWKVLCVFHSPSWVADDTLCRLEAEKLSTKGKFSDYHEYRQHLLVGVLAALWLYPVWLMLLSVTNRRKYLLKFMKTLLSCSLKPSGKKKVN